MRIDRIVPALAIALGVASLPASAQTGWRFSYTGFLLKETGEFQPGYVLDGSFRGSDANGDGTLTRDELTMFVWGGYDYFDNEYQGCVGSRCTLDGFSYGLADGKLAFTADWRYSDEAINVSEHTVAGLEHTRTQDRYQPVFEETQRTYLWTGQTRFEINPPPVPEPATPALMAGGLVVLGIAQARRRGRRARA